MDSRVMRPADSGCRNQQDSESNTRWHYAAHRHIPICSTRMVVAYTTVSSGIRTLRASPQQSLPINVTYCSPSSNPSQAQLKLHVQNPHQQPHNYVSHAPPDWSTDPSPLHFSHDVSAPSQPDTWSTATMHILLYPICGAKLRTLNTPFTHSSALSPSLFSTMGIPYSRQINAAFEQVTPLVAAGYKVLQTTRDISILLAVIQVLTVVLLFGILLALVAVLYCVNPDLEVPHSSIHIS
jgi:hypothetical protein